MFNDVKTFGQIASQQFRMFFPTYHRFSSITKPRNLVENFCILRLLFILISGIVVGNVLRLEWKIIKFVFSIFNNNLFLWNHAEILINSSFILVASSLILIWSAMTLVSSAKSKHLKKFEVLGKSFIKVIKRRGPKIELWDTPNYIYKWETLLELTYVNCLRLVR